MYESSRGYRVSQPPGGRSQITFGFGNNDRNQVSGDSNNGYRVNQPPGGRSQVFLGGDTNPALSSYHSTAASAGYEGRVTAPSRQSAPSPTQNFGNGFSVSQPPGGRSSFTLGNAQPLYRSYPALSNRTTSSQEPSRNNSNVDFAVTAPSSFRPGSQGVNTLLSRSSSTSFDFKGGNDFNAHSKLENSNNNASSTTSLASYRNPEEQDQDIYGRPTVRAPTGFGGASASQAVATNSWNRSVFQSAAANYLNPSEDDIERAKATSQYTNNKKHIDTGYISRVDNRSQGQVNNNWESQFTGERLSTRTSQPPGGRSTFRLH